MIRCVGCNADLLDVQWLGPALMVLSNTAKYRCPKCGATRVEPQEK